MSNIAKPVVVIMVAVALAAAVAFFLTRSETPVSSETSAAPPPNRNVTAPGWTRGSSGAAITLVEFGDYQCPHCAAYHPVVNEVLRRYTNQVRLEFHHYPLISIHRNAMMAAMAAEAAGEQGRFWEMHDLLFESQPSWAESLNPEPEFLSLASRIGLNANRFMQGLRSPDLQQKVLSDVVKAREIQVEGVPAFYIRGQPLRVRPFVEDFAQILDTELQKSK